MDLHFADNGEEGLASFNVVKINIYVRKLSVYKLAKNLPRMAEIIDSPGQQGSELQSQECM